MQSKERVQVPPIRVSLGVALSLLALSPNAAPQAPAADMTLAESARKAVMSASHGVTERDGVVRATGRGYAARFEGGAIELLPALGEAAPHDLPLRFSLDEIRRGDTLMHAADTRVAPQRDSDRIAYVRGDTIEERYDVSAAGVYQSFVFNERPPGSGDLVVRGHIDTELIPHPHDDGGLTFEADGLGGVHYGAVTGIDGAGRTAPGTLWSDGTVIELTLPGEFVDSAVLPLVLDPLISAQIAVNDSAWNDRDPDVAFGNSTYMIVWERVYSASHYGVYAQKVEDDGELFHGMIEVYDEGTRDRDPAIAFVEAADSFLIAWEHSANGLPNIILAAQVYWYDEEATVANIVSGPSGNGQNNPRVGGDHSGTDNEAIVVWQHAGVGVQGRLVNVEEGFAPNATGVSFTIDANSGIYDAVAPYISRSVGAEGSFLVVWERRGASASQIWARAYTRDGDAVTDATVMSFEILTIRDNTNPVCDGDGTSFVVAWERSETWPTNGYRDVVGKAVEIRDDQLDVATFHESYGDAINIDEQRPSVAITTSMNALVAWVQPNILGLGQSLKTVGVNAFTGEASGEMSVVANLEFVRTVAVAGATGSFHADEAFIAWGVDTTSGQPRDVEGRVYKSPGTWLERGGDCGDGGETYTPNPVAGNSLFRVHLRGATPGVLAALVIGGTSETISCGPCRLIPKVESVYYRTTDDDGNAQVLIPIDLSLANVTFFAQWATFVPIGACPLAPLDFSNTLQTTIASAP